MTFDELQAERRRVRLGAVRCPQSQPQVGDLDPSQQSA